ncbi:hypothetical protein [Chlamydia caviae]|uniref:Uncharacterized protein n=1 Tax=Chlamydia caviae (strain ATCC VR-813 / DSM 19441 / 03DC25 / GPIC) TaxID=227941 RepID=Q822H5_CHLCV|nr:hypothetical protein [Chlamydia caviae]AAP05449.1 hypothetical protein CCA_00707 [Chlamydia caviae GPIC]
MSSSNPSLVGSSDPAPTCPFQNWTPPRPNPQPAEITNLSQRISGFVTKFIPLTDDGCTKRSPKCPSCPREACVHSGNGEPMMNLCNCWTCCFGKPTINDTRGFYNFIKEYARIHGNACAAHSMLQAGINIATASKQRGEISEEEKRKMAKCCPTVVRTKIERGYYDVTRISVTMMDLVSDLQEEGVITGLSGQLLNLWHTAPRDVNPDDAQKIWIRDADGRLSPFCYLRCLHYIRAIRCFRTDSANPLQGNFLLLESPASIIAASVMYSLAALLNSDRFRDLLLEEESDGEGGTIYTCPYRVVQMLILLSMLARGKQPFTGRPRHREQLKDEEKCTIILASNEFRERVLGKFIQRRPGVQTVSVLLREFPSTGMNLGLKPWSRVSSTSDSTDSYEPTGSGELEAEPGPSRRRRRRQTPPQAPSSSTESATSPETSERCSPPNSPASSGSSPRRLVTVEEAPSDDDSDLKQLASFLQEPIVSPLPSSPASSCSSPDRLVIVEEAPSDDDSDLEQLAASLQIQIVSPPPPRSLGDGGEQAESLRSLSVQTMGAYYTETGEGTSAQPAEEPTTSSATPPVDSSLPPKKRGRNWQPTDGGPTTSSITPSEDSHPPKKRWRNWQPT